MKKIVLSAFAAFALIGCNTGQIEEPVVPSEEREMVFHAVCGADDAGTRTVRQEDGKVFWSPGEKISIFQGNQDEGGAMFTSTNTTDAQYADFKGTLSGQSGDYWALYPYNVESWCYDGSYVVTTFTNQQKAVAGSFPDNLYIALARSGTTDLSFKHPLGGIKFSVLSSGIKRATLKAIGGESLAGSLMALDFDNNGKAFVGACWYPWDYIELTPEDGGTFVPGEAYYFVTVPVTMAKGFYILFEKQDGTVFTRTVDKSVTVSRATFRTLMEADKGATWATPTLNYSPSAISVSSAGGTFSIDVSYPGNYHVDVAGCDWITSAGTEGDARFLCHHYFKASPNTGGQRMGVITVCDESNCYPVIVTQSSGEGAKNIVHHSLGMRFTATWCGWCPVMNSFFAAAKSNLGDKFYIVNLHTSSSNLAYQDVAPLLNQYVITGYPTGIVDGRALIENYTDESYGASVVASAVQETEDLYPVMTSAGISSTLNGRTLNVKVKVFARDAGEYKLTAMLLESGIIGYQADFVNGAHSNYVHDNIARMTLTGSSAGDTFTASTANSTMEFNYSVNVPSSYNLDNMSVLVYVQNKFGQQKRVQSDNYGDWYIDNCRLAPLGAALEPEVQ